MRAAEDDRVDTCGLQRLCVPAHGLLRLLAIRVVALDQRNEERACDRKEGDAGIECAHELTVTARVDGALRREQTDAAIARRLDGGVRLRREDTDDRDRELFL